MEECSSTARVHTVLLEDALSKAPFPPLAMGTMGLHEPPNLLPNKQGLRHLSPRREDVNHLESIDDTLIVPEPDTQKVVRAGAEEGDRRLGKSKQTFPKET